jgi:hypothetical protein
MPLLAMAGGWEFARYACVGDGGGVCLRARGRAVAHHHHIMYQDVMCFGVCFLTSPLQHIEGEPGPCTAERQTE